MSFSSLLSFLPFTADVVLLILLLVVGIFVIIFVAKVILFILPGAIIGVVVWFLTGSFFLAGIAFLLVAFISLLKG
ncbi:MAG: hypothetical protein ACOC6H_03920 [Thermoproteota archaeon]